MAMSTLSKTNFKNRLFVCKTKTMVPYRGLETVEFSASFKSKLTTYHQNECRVKVFL
jgi:hypothetical protein